MKIKIITKGLSNNYYLVLTDMRVPQGDHEDFKFLGISNTSRQDFGHLGSSIDCIYPFFLWKNPGVMLIVAVPRPWGSSALYLIWWQYNFKDQHILVWLRMIFKCHVAVDLESVILIFSNYIYALLTKREVKKAGYWPSSFLPLLDSKMTLRSIKTPTRIQLSWPNKLGQKRICFMAKKRTCSCRTDMGNPERPRWAHFACSSNQSEQTIRFFLPTCGFNHIMR